MRKYILLAHDALFVGSYIAVALSFLIFWAYTATHPMTYVQWVLVADLWERCALLYSAMGVGMTLSAVTVRGLIDQPRIYARLPPAPPQGQRCIYP